MMVLGPQTSHFPQYFTLCPHTSTSCKFPTQVAPPVLGGGGGGSFHMMNSLSQWRKHWMYVQMNGLEGEGVLSYGCMKFSDKGMKEALNCPPPPIMGVSTISVSVCRI